LSIYSHECVQATICHLHDSENHCVASVFLVHELLELLGGFGMMLLLS
jgi:hypothetical protein